MNFVKHNISMFNPIKYICTMATTTKPKTTSKSTTQNTTSKTTATRGKVRPKRTAAEELRELFVDSLKDIYWAEKALTKALPKMAKNATSEELAMAIDEHLAVTQEQVARLEKVFGIMGEKATAKKCEAMDGLIKEGETIMQESQPGAVRDAGIIGAAQKVEHYEIATYGTLVAWAKTLGEDDAAEQLEMTLAEEKEADQILTDKAYNTINFDAAVSNSEMSI